MLNMFSYPRHLLLFWVCSFCVIDFSFSEKVYNWFFPQVK